MRNNQPPLKMSTHCSFLMVVMMMDNQSPSKTSADARFQGWWDSGAGEQPTTIKNEHVHSFSRVVGCGE
jgi:hypothetical protein